MSNYGEPQCELCGVYEYETGTPVSRDRQEHVDIRECIRQLKKEIVAIQEELPKEETEADRRRKRRDLF